MHKDALFFGLHGLQLPGPSFELGRSIIIRKTYASIFAPFMVAFAPPESPDKHHPGPWSAASGGVSYEISAELVIPIGQERGSNECLQIARIILFLLRLGVNPAITLPVFSNMAFSKESAEAKDQTLHLFEVQRRSFALAVDESAATGKSLGWVKENWETVEKLVNSSSKFALASEAIDQGQFVQNTALTLVSLWGALEALFLTDRSELSFRVSSLIASFLEAPGDDRKERQKKIAGLYGKRSAAAHGTPKHSEHHVLDSFNLLREVLFKIIERGSVPTSDQLNSMLFGADQ
jgi:hypothetical protein